jgi:hypothetical protein
VRAIGIIAMLDVEADPAAQLESLKSWAVQRRPARAQPDLHVRIGDPSMR